ncbi:MAG: hypothetical protein ACFFHV_16880, partial [Promethearchaeota archaeon]
MKSKQKAKLILLVLSMILIIPVVNINLTTNRIQIEQENIEISDETNDTENDDTATTENPSSSGAEYVGINKTITAGVQTNAWNEDNIKYNDSSYDETDFALTSTDIHKESAHYAWAHGVGTDEGTTGGISVNSALRDNDNQYLYVHYNPDLDDWEFPDDIRIEWGYYSNFQSSLHRGVYQIKIKYEIMPKYGGWNPWGDVGNNLKIKFKTSDGSWGEWIAIKRGIVEDGKTYYGTITIDDTNPLEADIGTILSSVRRGYWIKTIEVKMEPYYADTKICVDYLDIYYSYYQKEVDFEYEMELDGN